MIQVVDKFAKIDYRVYNMGVMNERSQDKSGPDDSEGTIQDLELFLRKNKIFLQDTSVGNPESGRDHAISIPGGGEELGQSVGIKSDIDEISKPYAEALLLRASSLIKDGKATKIGEVKGTGWLKKTLTNKYASTWTHQGLGPGDKGAAYEFTLGFSKPEKGIVLLDYFGTLLKGSGPQSSPVRLTANFDKDNISGVVLSWDGFYTDTALSLLDNPLGNAIKDFYFCTRKQDGINWGKLYPRGHPSGEDRNYASSVTTYSTSGSSIRLKLSDNPSIELAQTISGSEKFSERYIKGGWTRVNTQNKHISYVYDRGINKFVAYIHGTAGADNPQIVDNQSVAREIFGLPQKATEPPKEEMSTESFLGIYKSMLGLIPTRRAT